MSDSIGGIGTMRDGGDGYMIIDADEEEDVEFYPIDSIELSEDTEWFFEGALLSMLQLVDDTFPSVDISTPVCSEDVDGDLGIWVRFDFGGSALWLRVMTFSTFHWVWCSEEYN